MKAKSKQPPAPKPPKVRLAKPTGRPWQIRYTCPIEKRELRISTNTHDEGEALEQKKGIEAKLLLGIEVKPRKSRAVEGPHMPWEEFREQYTRLKVATFRSENSIESAELRLDVCERIVSPRTLSAMASPANLARLQAELLSGVGGNRKVQEPRSPHTVRSYMATLIAALNWAHRPMKWLPDSIEFDLLDADEPDKGRPITTEEFERMLEVVPKVLAEVGEEADAIAVASWRYLLCGLWESGLRLGEAMSMSWDNDKGIVPHWPRRKLPYLRIPAARQKNRKAQDVPTTPAMSELLLRTPDAARKGWVFNPAPRRAMAKRLTTEQAGRIISLFGDKAGIVVNADGKTASAHDLRRSFGQRMADAGLPVRDLQAIMRHSSITTTEKYYLRDRVQDQAERIAKYLGTSAQKESGDSQKENAATR